MSGTNHHKNFLREFEKRFKANGGRYDFGDFAYDLYREKLSLIKKFGDYRSERDKIEYGI